VWVGEGPLRSPDESEYDDIFAGADRESVMAFGACMEAERPSETTKSSEIRDSFADCVYSEAGSPPDGF